jgi:hypothetical protein
LAFRNIREIITALKAFVLTAAKGIDTAYSSSPTSYISPLLRGYVRAYIADDMERFRNWQLLTSYGPMLKNGMEENKPTNCMHTHTHPG